MTLLPVVRLPWSEAVQIIDPETIVPKLGDPEPGRVGLNDFCLAQDDLGRWHCTGILRDLDNSELFHAVSEELFGPYRWLPHIQSGCAVPNGVNMWAPFIARPASGPALLYYAHLKSSPLPGEAPASLRLLQSDGHLDRWGPRGNPDLGENILFAERHARDPQILFDDRLGLYLLYYVIGDGWSEPEEGNVVRVRTSGDLLTWSEPVTVIKPPPGYRAAESIFVLPRNGLYYMWLCGFDYGRMSLYVSETPFCFGDPVRNRLLETPGHAPEIVTVDGADWMACVTISTKPGNHPAWHDLPGIWMQRIEWIEMPSELAARIHRKPNGSTLG